MNIFTKSFSQLVRFNQGSANISKFRPYTTNNTNNKNTTETPKINANPVIEKEKESYKDNKSSTEPPKNAYSGGFWFNEYWRLIGVGVGLPVIGYLFYQEVNKPKDTVANVTPIPGHKMSIEKKILETGGDMLQRFDPVKSVHMHLVGFHFYNGDIKRQVEAHHYCNHINEDVAQCIIYDSDKPDAKLIGIEYVISEKLFKTLPPEEQSYWHSHVYEVKSGLLVAPRLPQVAENQLMSHLITTYGKTIHTWEIDKYALPLGPPQVMMAFTKDQQVNPELVKTRDNYYNISTDDKKKARESMVAPIIVPGADCWSKGKTIQLTATNKK